MKPFDKDPESPEDCEPDHECILYTPDCDICPECKEHAEFCLDCGSNCCGAQEARAD